jgi:predicted secreted hydrolase
MKSRRLKTAPTLDKASYRSSLARWMRAGCGSLGGKAYVRDGSWLRKNVSERSKATSDLLASTLRRADWLFLRLRGLEMLPEVILSDLETLALMSSWGWRRQAASFMAN